MGVVEVGWQSCEKSKVGNNVNGLGLTGNMDGAGW